LSRDAKGSLAVGGELVRIYEIVSSELAVQELTAGDPEWARRRLKLLETVPIVSMNDEAEQMALELVSRRIIPIKAQADAFHIALAATNGVEFLLTWNFKHLANAMLRRKINEVCEDFGYVPLVICTPNELLGEERPHV
jgi:hypothetical protein